ncbi:MAG: D-alanyl-D-alanine carboxypeptidase [Boseongicola sp. SB0670_bin_30]|nr:D-alanyl-D-alanine carboxypeptidase [Boseongicola sp. SB0670_bin_30]
MNGLRQVDGAAIAMVSGAAFRFALIACFFLHPIGGSAAPYAAMVMDARTGEVLHSRNADTKLHPASLTKMMTLYVVFDAVERGEIGLDQKVGISRKAASEPPSKLGLRSGQKVKVRYLVRAAAVRSANDAATALGEAVSGSEARFARRMNDMAKAMGLNKTNFKNAHGLTEQGHLSTARDMTVLGRHLFYDFPDYYNLFSRRSTSAGQKTVRNTNRRLLNAYRGADGIKTGYTRAAGFNLVASAERDGKRVIATVFGGRSVTSRNQRVAELLDMGFSRSPNRVAVKKPRRPVLNLPASIVTQSGRVVRSSRPPPRPVSAPADGILIAISEEISDVLVEVALSETTIPVFAESAAASGNGRKGIGQRPVLRPLVAQGSAREELDSELEGGQGVLRASGDGELRWGINVGLFKTRGEAERVLLQTALVEIATLDAAKRSVVRGPTGWEANFLGLSEDGAALACSRLRARSLPCTPRAPG